MSSPVVYPLAANIKINSTINRPIYLQITDQIVHLIKNGVLHSATRMPSSRVLSEELDVHRKTILAAYEELILQGWLTTIPSKGTFVNKDLPLVKPSDDFTSINCIKTKNTSGFCFVNNTMLPKTKAVKQRENQIIIPGGAPDHRLVNTLEISRTYRNILNKEHHQDLLTYHSVMGNPDLIDSLIPYLKQTRGIQVSKENILITRGSQMAIYLTSRLIGNKARIVCSKLNYQTANQTFTHSGATIIKVGTDSRGIITRHIEELCKREKVQAVYVTPHHHYPTTVSLSPDRRIHLLQLAQKYKFVIIEDDYDYDFHYDNAPILPLASHDIHNQVIHIGGFTKLIAPAFRIGYMIAPGDFIQEAANLRRIIDRQGDTILEKSLSIMLNNGDLQRQIQKTKKIYKKRRDLLCKLLNEKLKNYFEFDIPKGGMCVWLKIKKPLNWKIIEKKAISKGYNLTQEWNKYDTNEVQDSFIRMGFAKLNEEEIIKFVNILEKIIKA